MFKCCREQTALPDLHDLPDPAAGHVVLAHARIVLNGQGEPGLCFLG